MTTPPLAAGNLPLPRWAYVPGEAVEADADYETLAQVTALVPSRFGGHVPARHPALRYALLINDHGYFWESQEILEAVWAAAPQGGRERILLRACIQIATANLRLRMQSRTPQQGCSARRSPNSRRSACATPVATGSPTVSRFWPWPNSSGPD